MKISGVYQIINKITGDFYIGSSVDLGRRKRQHFNENTWKRVPNSHLYKDMKQYGKDSFLFKPIWLCDSDELKKYEQIAIDKYNPKYNIRDACTGMSKEEYQKQYNKQYKKENLKSLKQYYKQYYKEHADNYKQYYKEHADNYKQYQKQWYKENIDSIKQYKKQKNKQYYSQQCLYESELLTLGILRNRFIKKGIKNPTSEAKKYLVGE